jgi:dTDP-4-amino-4,6-dideoxygalactose transaminase
MLAINGGTPIRTKEFQSTPYINDEEIDIVVQLLKDNNLSKFVGSPHEHVEEMLLKPSMDLSAYKMEKSFLGGKYIRDFEYAFSKKIESPFCISVNSATSGLITAILALDNQNKHIITTPFSFTASTGAILLTHYTPIFCDIDLDTFNISPESLKYLMIQNPELEHSTILPVHWCGNASNFEKIFLTAKYHNLKIIEDATQSPFSLYKNKFISIPKNNFLGTYGDIGVFSFNEPKNIQTGEGGMIVTEDPYLAKQCRLIRNHGENIDSSTVVGYNFRLTELQAAIGIKQLEKANYLNGIRRNNWKFLKQEIIHNFGEFIIPQKITHEETFNAYSASFRFITEMIGISRDMFAKALIAEGIPVSTGPHRLLCDHKMTTHLISYVPNARKLHSQYLSFFQIGYPNTFEDMYDIIHAIKKIIDNKKELE